MSLRCLSLIAIVVFISTEAVPDEYVMKAVGDEVSFRPDNTLPSLVTSIIWKHRNSCGIVVKVIEWDEDEILIPNPRFKGITNLDVKTGQITITNLTVNHSGDYTFEINIEEQEQRFILTVVEWVPKPVIKTQWSDNPDVVYLICEYNETIIWKNSAGEKLNGSVLRPRGESITVKNQGNPANFYTCTLDNGTSKKTSDPVYERDLFEDSNRGFVICISIVLISKVLFTFFLLLYGYCAGRRKTSRK